MGFFKAAKNMVNAARGKKPSKRHDPMSDALSDPLSDPLAGGLTGGVASLQADAAAATHAANADNYTTMGGFHLNLGFGDPVTVQTNRELQGEAPPTPKGPGALAAKGLKKAGGKGKSGSGYKAIRKQLEALDTMEGSDAEKQYAAEVAKRDIKQWREKHNGRGERGTKRDKAMKRALGTVDDIRTTNIVGDDPALRAAFEGATPDLETLTAAYGRAGHHRQLQHHHRSRRNEAEKRGDADDQQRHQAAMKQSDFMFNDLKLKTPDMEERYLKDQVSQHGKLGGQSLGAIGSGAAGTAHRARFGEEELIFKAQEDLPQVMNAAGTTAEIGAQRSVASSRVNDLLGTSVIGKTELAEMDGMYGTVMPNAEGASVRQAMSPADLGIERSQVPENAVQAGGGKIFADTGFDFSDPKLQEGLLDLQLNDILSAQVDRHAGNYHVSRGEDGAVDGVHGFDLDASFGSDMVDWSERMQDKGGFGEDTFANAVDFPPLVSERQAQMIETLDLMALHGTLADLLPEEEISAAVQRAIELKDHVALLRQEGHVVDGFNQETFGKLVQAGGKKSYVARDHLSTETMKATMEAIEELRNQGAQATAAASDAQADQLDQSGLLA